MAPLAQDTEKLFGRLFDNANLLIIYFDNAGAVRLCNKKLEQITGRRKEELVGEYWYSVLYREGTVLKQQMLKAVLDDSITYKRPNRYEGIIIDKENSEHFISWSITPMLKDDASVEGILLVGEDITDLKESEASIKKIDDTLKNIFSNIKEYALYVINLDGNITYYGLGSEMMFGWQKNEIIFKHAGILLPSQDASNKLNLILEQVRKLGQYETEVELIRKDGISFPVILTVNQFLDAGGKLTGYIFMAKDITERKKLEYQIFQSEKLAAIGQLAAGMAHEINNPLFVISGRIEMLLEEKKISSGVKESLSIVNTQADRIRKLVDQLLKFARKTPPKLEVIDINETIESVLPLLAYHKLPSSDISIEKSLASGLPTLKGDLNQLQEVFVNLFLNAYQSMLEGGRLSISTANFQNQFVEIRISDTGQGIKQEDIKNIFVPFFSTKKNGTGLGLSICYNIIKNHNGSVEVESQANKGTTFIIKLPFA
ncbi:MAG TPA: PAS domain S-box protein [Candidatus Margulisiibacteriota bacterium]|nr:PAS domain S-box protein [Candidatus Margulisiibacteriota bacterium]